MQSLIKIQRKLLPDLLDVMQKRYQILQYIRLMQPIGRRSLATSLGLTERTLRSEVQFLKEQGLIDSTTSGMLTTEEGLSVLTDLEMVMKDLSGLDVLERRVKEMLKLKEVIIVPGDSDRVSWVKQEMGRAAVNRMKRSLKANDIVAVTGGTTMAAVADMMSPDDESDDILFVPARGGLGEDVKNQANSICAAMAERASGQYRLLHVPDQVSDEAYQSFIKDPIIKDVLDLIKSANVVVHGIGEAKTMAIRRKESAEAIRRIEEQHAVGEAFGYYFDKSGSVVHRVKTVGIQLDDLRHIDHVIAVAGGSSKANAISAYMKQGINSVLVTDEGAAKALLGDSSL